MSTAHPKPSLDVAEPASKRARTSAQQEEQKGSAAENAVAAAPAFVHPADWPKEGPINLATADLPHDSADTEVRRLTDDSGKLARSL